MTEHQLCMSFVIRRQRQPSITTYVSHHYSKNKNSRLTESHSSVKPSISSNMSRNEFMSFSTNTITASWEGNQDIFPQLSIRREISRIPPFIFSLICCPPDLKSLLSDQHILFTEQHLTLLTLYFSSFFLPTNTYINIDGNVSMLTIATSVIWANDYLVSRGTLLPSTQLSCSGTLSGGVVCTSTGSWPATEAGLPVAGGIGWGEFSDWLTWSVEPRAWFRAVIEGCWWWGAGHKIDPWWLDSCSVNRRKQ